MEVAMKKKICQYLSDVLVEMSEEELFKTMEIPPEEKMGDLVNISLLEHYRYAL